MGAILLTRIDLELIPYRHSGTACHNLKTQGSWPLSMRSGCSRGNAPKWCKETSQSSHGGFFQTCRRIHGELTDIGFRQNPRGFTEDSQWICQATLAEALYCRRLCRGLKDALQGDSGMTDTRIRGQLVGNCEGARKGLTQGAQRIRKQ